MRLLALVVIAAAFRPGPLRAQPRSSLSPEVREFVSVDAPVVALTKVRLIDGTGGPVLEDQTVVIANGKIQAVGRSATVRVPASARVLDLAGHTVMPGMVGMHNHTYQYFGWRAGVSWGYYDGMPRWVQLQHSAPRLYLASGVTTIRPTGSANPYADMQLKAAIDRGEVPGPRMHLTGPYITGEKNFGGLMHKVSSPDQVRRVVAYWAEEGVTWFKAYTTISRAELKAAIDEAHKRGIKVTGHLCSVTAREAVALGIDQLEHGLVVNTDYAAEKKPDVCPPNAIVSNMEVDLNSAAVRATFRDMTAKNVPMTSTLPAVEYVVAPHRVVHDQRVVDALSTEHRPLYAEALRIFKTAREEDRLKSAGLLKKAMQYEVAFVKAGGLLAAGVDVVGFLLPGFGDQRNFELLIEAGFTPPQVVQILSANGAKVLGEFERVGTITAGKLADLIVINGNPALNPDEIRKVTLVFKDGVGYDPAKLIESVKGRVGLQ